MDALIQVLGLREDQIHVGIRAMLDLLTEESARLDASSPSDPHRVRLHQGDVLLMQLLAGESCSCVNF